MSETKEKTRGNRAVLSATLALLTAASVTVGGMFDSPDAILDPDEPNAIVAQAMKADDDADEPDTGEEDVEKTRRRAGIGASLRAWILHLPLAVRLIAVVPMWALGSLILGAAGALWSAVGTPLLSHVLSTLALFAVLLGAFCAAAKTIFPDLPLRKIVNRRSMAALLIGAVLLGAADAGLPLVWKGYEQIRRLVELGGSLLLLTGVTARFTLREQKKRCEAKQLAKPQPEKPKQPEVLEFLDESGPIRIDLRRLGKNG